MSYTNIIENQFQHLIDKLRDFGIDPISFLSARLAQLQAEEQAETETEGHRPNEQKTA